jgi:hypothetical protein
VNARVCVCDIRELPTLQDLHAWAAAHRTRVTYLGPTLEGDEVVAYRPPGWTGQGDPHERIAAPSREAMRATLMRRRKEKD